MREMAFYLSCSIWLITLNIISIRSAHVANDNFTFFKKYLSSIPCVSWHYLFFINSFVSGWLGYFRFFVTVYNTAMYMNSLFKVDIIQFLHKSPKWDNNNMDFYLQFLEDCPYCLLISDYTQHSTLTCSLGTDYLCG